jgi:hypothetical protein
MTGGEGGRTTPRKKPTKGGKKTPRNKATIRGEKFFAYEWEKLPTSIKHAFLVHVCDQEGWHYEEEEVLDMSDAEALAEIIEFTDDVRMDFPWADDVQTYLELGDNFALFKVTDEDAAALAEIRHAFDKKIEAEREKLSKASPRTRSRKLVRALSVQSPDPSLVEDEQEPRLSSAEVRKIQEDTRKEEAKRRAAEQKKREESAAREERKRDKEIEERRAQAEATEAKLRKRFQAGVWQTRLPHRRRHARGKVLPGCRGLVSF